MWKHIVLLNAWSLGKSSKSECSCSSVQAHVCDDITASSVSNTAASNRKPCRQLRLGFQTNLYATLVFMWHNWRLNSGLCQNQIWRYWSRICLTLLILARELVGQAVGLRRGGQHESEAHKEGRVLGQRTVRLFHVPRLTRDIGATARGIAHTDPLSWGHKHTQDLEVKDREQCCTFFKGRVHPKPQ